MERTKEDKNNSENEEIKTKKEEEKITRIHLIWDAVNTALWIILAIAVIYLTISGHFNVTHITQAAQGTCQAATPTLGLPV